jgi:hypothetical protein
MPVTSNLPFTSFPGDYSTLPTVSFVIPNQDHDMHDGTIAQADTWLQQNLAGYAQWAGTHNSLLIVQWDEDDYSGTNHIPTIFYGAEVVPGQYSETINHYNMLRTLEDMYGLSYAGASSSAAAITDIWTAGTATVTATATVTSTPTNTFTPTTIPTSQPTVTPTATATGTTTPCAISFSDVTDPSSYYYTPVQYLACGGVLGGYGDGTFRPYSNTTRGQMAKIVVLADSLPIQTPAGGAYTFADNPPGSTFFAYVETALADGIVGGYACGGSNPQTGGAELCDSANRPYYRPGNNITRGQLAKIVVIAAVQTRGWTPINPATPSFTDVPAGSSFYTFVETAVCHGVVGGYSDGTFRSGANATRGQIAKIVYIAITGTQPCSGLR